MWQSGYAADCKSVYPGSIPGFPSKSENFMGEITRAERRHRRETVIANRKKKLKRLYLNREDFLFGKFHKWSGVRCSNPKCIFCSNPRKTFQTVTIAEEKENINFKEQMIELEK